MREAYLAAKPWLGTPFHWEASLRGIGCDCRGLLSGVARDLDRPEARAIEARLVGYSRRIDQDALLAGLDRLFQRARLDIWPNAGDILAFRLGRRDRVQHLGIMGDRDRFIHASSVDPDRVIETPLAALHQGRRWCVRLAGVWAWREIETAA